MENLTVLQIFIASVLLSLGILAAFFALFWRQSKNADLSYRNLLVEFVTERLSNCSFILAGLGIVGMAVAMILALYFPPQGLLQSDALYTLRMPETLEVADLNRADKITAGDVIAIYRSPKDEAERVALRHKCSAFEAQLRVVKHQPAEADARLLQRQRELEAEHRHLRGAIERITLERRQVQRDKTRDVQAKKKQITELQSALAELPQKIIQMRAELVAKESKRRRLLVLSERRASSQEELDDVKKDITVHTAEIERLRAKVISMTLEKKQAEADVQELTLLLNEQATSFDNQLAKLRKELSGATSQRAALAKDVARDLATAKERKRAELERIQQEIKQTKEKIDGLEGTLKVKTPLTGRVVYRNPSPRTVYKDDPLLVVAPPNAFRFRVRLYTAQAMALSGQEEITLELLRLERKTGDDKQSPRHLVRRFAGRPLHFRTLEHEPSITLVELDCDPPDEAVRELALGEIVPGQIVWLPPLYTLPLFVFGAIPAMLGGLGLILARILRPKVTASSEVTYQPQAANARIRQESPDEATVRLLGEQLGEMIRDGELDPSLMATVEWVLDQHGRQGQRLLADGLWEHGDFSDSLATFTPQTRRNGSVNGRDPLERLFRLLEILSPEQVNYRRDLSHRGS